MTQQSDALDALVRPSSIAIVGASADSEKLNGRIVRFLKDKGYGGAIYPINPRVTEILGLRCYPSLEAVPGHVDLAVIGLAAAQAPAAIREAGRKGVRAVLVFASGFAELGEEGKRLQAELAATAREAGVRLCGPNSVGVVNAFDRVVATFSQVGNNEVKAGPFAFVTQSGAVGTVTNTLANRRGLGLGYLVHTGNEADLTAVDAMTAISVDARVKVIGAYLEGVRDGEALCALAQRLLPEGKPIIAIKVGRSAAGARAVASHTGALAAEDRVFDDLARQFGIVRARHEAHMLDLAEAFAYCPLPGEGGVAFITQSGGTAVMMADRAEELGLAVPTLTPATQDRMRGFLPAYASFVNPVDASMQAVADPSLLGKGLAAMLDDPQIAVGIAWLQHMDAKADQLVEMFSELSRAGVKPLIVAWAAAPQRALDELRRRGVCVAASTETAVDMAHALISYAAARRRFAATTLRTVAPATAPPVSGAVASIDAAARLAACGVPLARARLAHSAEDAAAIAAAMQAPVALKIESADLPHKTDVGGVRLDLREPEAVRAAYAEILANAKRAAPQARIAGVLVQEMLPSGVELVVGLRRDPSFGMVLMLGIGGVFVEAYKDVTFRKVPVDATTARAMVGELRGARLLGAFRGRPAVDLERLVALLCAVGDFGAANAGWLAELDLNPVIARHDTAIAVDWLMLGA